jgi:hypothetical protein
VSETPLIYKKVLLLASVVSPQHWILSLFRIHHETKNRHTARSVSQLELIPRKTDTKKLGLLSLPTIITLKTHELPHCENVPLDFPHSTDCGMEVEMCRLQI